MVQVAEVEVGTNGEVRVRRVVCAVDCGSVVNRDTIEAQVEGAVIFGISAALHGNITIKNGRVEQSNFHDYQVLRMNEVPAIETHIVRNTEHPAASVSLGSAPLCPRSGTRSSPLGKRLQRLECVRDRYSGLDLQDSNLAYDPGSSGVPSAIAARAGPAL